MGEYTITSILDALEIGQCLISEESYILYRHLIRYSEVALLVYDRDAKKRVWINPNHLYGNEGRFRCREKWYIVSLEKGVYE